jgi:hypothetical protein
VNFHTRLVGAFDAIILSLHAALMIALLFALLDPSYDKGRPAATLAQRQPAVAQHVVARDMAGLSLHL